MTFLRIIAFLAGAGLTVFTILSAIKTFVVPRGLPNRLTRAVFLAWRIVFGLRLRSARTYEEKDRALAFYAPVSLLTLPAVWLVLVLMAYSLMFWSLRNEPFDRSMVASGSSLLTLGFASFRTLKESLLAFSEAAIGLSLGALLIAYLPTMYAAFQRREWAVTLLETEAGSPPSAIVFLQRFHRIDGLDRLQDEWPKWQSWFADISESHTSLAPLVFYRSPKPDRSWVTAAGAILDTAALRASTLDLPRDPEAELCLRAGYLALQRIIDFFPIEYDPDPHFPSTPISITRSEYDAAYDALAADGIRLKPDRDQAWTDFAGWRVNYDRVLLALAAVTQAPPAPWSSDRAVPWTSFGYFRDRR
jgi:hypothetical protein